MQPVNVPIIKTSFHAYVTINGQFTLNNNFIKVIIERNKVLNRQRVSMCQSSGLLLENFELVDELSTSRIQTCVLSKHECNVCLGMYCHCYSDETPTLYYIPCPGLVAI